MSTNTSLGPAIHSKDGLSLHSLGKVAVIVMDRKDNRFNPEFFAAFNFLLDKVESNEDYNGLITTGTGKFYSNGIDLQWMSQADRAERDVFFVTFYNFLKRISCFCVPTVAAINGHAFAGGAFLAFAHDQRLMRAEGRGWICFNEVHINMRFSNSMLIFCAEKIGRGKELQDALVLGKRFTAADALSAGWLHATTKPDDLLTDAAKRIQLAHGKQGILRQSLVNMKNDVYKTLLEGFDQDIASYSKAKL